MADTYPGRFLLGLGASHAHVVERKGGRYLHPLRTAAGRLGMSRRELAVVGDDPALEVPMARRGGALAVAVATGIGTAGAFADLPADQEPDLLVTGVAELLELCSAHHEIRRPH